MGQALTASLDWIEKELEALASAHLARSLRAVSSPSGAPELVMEGKRIVQFASNDYLGLSTHPAVIAAAEEALRLFGAGAGASRLISGNLSVHEDLERDLAAFKGAEAALVYATGSMANLGLLPCLVGKEDLVLMDKLDHATIYDAAALSKAEIQRFPHQDLQRLEAILDKADLRRRKVIVVEGVYSMDGDIAPLPELLALAEKYDATLVVDEAHATGVLGIEGRGVLQHFGLNWHSNLVLTGTLSKALGSLGGFVAGPRRLVDWLHNNSRSFIFATALPAVSAAAAAAALKVLAAEPERLRRLWINRESLAKGLKSSGWDTGASSTPILPVLTGSASGALDLQQRLWNAGYYAPAIRPPTVQAASCRLRLTVSSQHTEGQIHGLLQALGRGPR
jgi:glycine C-acetyltransferase/8-amino-7-oxononanoate synthase